MSKILLKSDFCCDVARGIGAFLSDAECRNISVESKPYLLHGETTTMVLKTMPIAKLQALNSQVEAAIAAKVTERRRELETGCQSRLASPAAEKPPSSVGVVEWDRWRPNTDGDLGGSWPQAALADSCHQGWQETRRLSDRGCG
jgi:hypothetical protein